MVLFKVTILFYQVSFRGETGIDGEGLEKEFWTLLSKEILRRYFEREEGNAVVKRDSSSLTVRKNSRNIFDCFFRTENTRNWGEFSQ